MSSTIKIKRSTGTAKPGTLTAGELAYSFGAGTQADNGDRLFFGNGTTVEVIGGKYFTDKLDHVPGTLTASSAILVGTNKEIDNIIVGNLDLVLNTLSSTDTNGAVVIDPNGNGKVELAFANNTDAFAQITGPTAAQYVTNIGGEGKENAIPNRQYVDDAAAAAAAGSILTVDADTGANVDVNLATDDLQLVANANGLSTSVAKAGTDVTVTFALAQDIQETASPTFADLTLTGGDLVTDVTGTATVFNTAATTLNVGGAATTVSIGAGTGTTTVNNDLTVAGDLAVNGSDITTTGIGTATVFNTNALTLNIGGAATQINIGDSADNSIVNFAQDVTIAGDLIVQGDTVTVDVATLNVEDPLIRLASNNTVGDTLDIGFVGTYGTDNTGIFRDATDGIYKVFATATVTGNVVSDITLAQLEAIIDGGTY